MATMATSDNRKAGMKAAHMPAPPPEPEQLACPRCNSTNTKFCYYNNYNFSQPRHFCKSCRRYWTHGGTLRDIPVGGATRKHAAKRPRTVTAPSTSPRHLPSQALFPLAADHGGGAFAGEGVRMSGSFTSLLNDGHPPQSNQTGSGLMALGGFGLDEAGFGLGRGLLWPAFPGVAGGGTGGGDDSGHTWQHENGESGFAGGGGYFAISTPASVFK